MKLKSLTIELQWYGEFIGQYVGKVKFEGKDGEVGIVLSPEVSTTVLAAVGENLAAITKKTADELAENIRLSVQDAKNAPVQLEDPRQIQLSGKF